MATSPWLQGLMPGSAGDLLSSFASPPMSARPKLRWWLPHGLVDTDELQREVKQMYDAGFGGAEIEDVHHSVQVTMDPEGHGWGTEAWVDAILAASTVAERLDFQIDMALGPSYPAANPDITPQSEAAEKEIATGRVVVKDGVKYNGAVPPPYVEAEDGVTNETLVTLQAYRMDDTSSVDAVPVVLKEDTLISLKCKVHGGNFTFTPPDNGTWIVIAFWMRGTGQLPEAGPHTDPTSYVIDHFSKAGVESSTNFWDKHILTPRVRKLMKHIKGSIFEDSIELEYSTLWTPNLRQEFKERKGYDLFRYLPAVAQEKQKNAFKFSDADLTRGVINDFWDVMGQLYVDYHIGSLKPWANDLGMKLRAQVYGLPTAAMTASGAIDIPEGESLGFKNLGDYRSIAGPANMRGQQLMSNEACAFAGAAYSTTWELVLKTLNPIFTTGNNHQVIHGFSYLEAPGADWPGFAAFTPYGSGQTMGYAESWGPRTPLWRHAQDITGYISRMQLLMQRGKPQHDVVFFEQKGYIGAGYNSPWWADSGVQQGWSLNIIGPDMLDYDSAFVRNGRLAPDGPAYKVLSFEQDTFSSAAPVMQLNSAKKLLELAKDGLPMLVIGDWSSASFYGWSEHKETDTLTGIFDELLSLPHVVNVPTRNDIPTGVQRLPVGPDVQLNGSQIINYHRVDGDIDYFLLVAAAPATFAVSTKTKVSDVDAEIVLPRRSAHMVPVLLDLWTGDVSSIGQYEEVSESQIRLRVQIKAYSSRMIALMPLRRKPVHATSSDALSLRRDGSGLYMRVNETGSYTTSLSNGRKKTVKVRKLPQTQELTNWRLSVQSWEPTSDISSPKTVYKTHVLKNLDELKPWTSFAQLQDVSGIGTYTTSFTLKDWTASNGAILEIPEFVGSFRLKVNGKKLPAQDQLQTEHDIGAWLKKGHNKLEIEVATPLLNRLRVVTPDTYSVASRQDYGLVGPITLRPYKEVRISQ